VEDAKRLLSPKGADADREFDVIVVGGGSSGCTLAARLSQQAGRRVLLLEAGADYGPISSLPLPMQRANVSPTTDPTSVGVRTYQATLAANVSAPSFRGELLGGTSVINGAVFTRGHPHDYDGWAADGCDAWSYESVVPYFQRLETDLDFGATDVHGAEGPMPVKRPPADRLNPVTTSFVDSCLKLGFRWDPDLNGRHPGGVGLMPMNATMGERQNVAQRYLEPVRLRDNLTVLSQQSVTEILIEKGRAIGVRCGTSRFYGEEIVLCAGALVSPHLLMVSGIGPADMLNGLGIPVRHDNDAVGRHLTDHPSIYIPFSLDSRWVDRDGAHCEANLGYYSADLGNPDEQDMRIFPTLRSNHWSVVAVDGDRTSLGMLCQLGRETSRGRLTPSSPQIGTDPIIDYGFLSESGDLGRLADGARLADEILAGPAFSKLGAVCELPIRDMSANELNDWIRANIKTGYHPASTCRMGPAGDPTAVVDQEFRVHGVDGLRVVDVSAMRTLVRRAPNVSTIMMAERAAQLMNN